MKWKNEKKYFMGLKKTNNSRLMNYNSVRCRYDFSDFFINYLLCCLFNLYFYRRNKGLDAFYKGHIKSYYNIYIYFISNSIDFFSLTTFKEKGSKIVANRERIDINNFINKKYNWVANSSIVVSRKRVCSKDYDILVSKSTLSQYNNFFFDMFFPFTCIVKNKKKKEGFRKDKLFLKKNRFLLYCIIELIGFRMSEHIYNTVNDMDDNNGIFIYKNMLYNGYIVVLLLSLFSSKLSDNDSLINWYYSYYRIRSFNKFISILLGKLNKIDYFFKFSFFFRLMYYVLIIKFNFFINIVNGKCSWYKEKYYIDNLIRLDCKYSVLRYINSIFLYKKYVYKNVNFVNLLSIYLTRNFCKYDNFYHSKWLVYFLFFLKKSILNIVPTDTVYIRYYNYNNVYRPYRLVQYSIYFFLKKIKSILIIYCDKNYRIYKSFLLNKYLINNNELKLYKLSVFFENISIIMIKLWYKAYCKLVIPFLVTINFIVNMHAIARMRAYLYVLLHAYLYMLLRNTSIIVYTYVNYTKYFNIFFLCKTYYNLFIELLYNCNYVVFKYIFFTNIKLYEFIFKFIKQFILSVFFIFFYIIYIFLLLLLFSKNFIVFIITGFFINSTRYVLCESYIFILQFILAFISFFLNKKVLIKELCVFRYKSILIHVYMYCIQYMYTCINILLYLNTHNSFIRTFLLRKKDIKAKINCNINIYDSLLYKILKNYGYINASSMNVAFKIKDFVWSHIMYIYYMYGEVGWWMNFNSSKKIDKRSRLFYVKYNINWVKANNFNKFLKFFFLKKGYLGLGLDFIKILSLDLKKKNWVNFLLELVFNYIYLNMSDILYLEILIKRFRFSTKFFFKNFLKKLDYKNIYVLEDVKFLNDFFLETELLKLFFNDKSLYFSVIPFLKNNSKLNLDDEEFNKNFWQWFIGIVMFLVKVTKIVLYVPYAVCIRIFVLIFFFFKMIFILSIIPILTIYYITYT